MKAFETEREENLKSRIKRLVFNVFPAYRRTGGRVCFISDDWHEVQVKLRLKWSTKNYLGSIFGGSLYGFCDPIYVIQLIMILGKDYIVWDKSATIRFIKPVRTKVYAQFVITEDEIEEIKEEVEEKKEAVVEMSIQLVDKNKTVYAEVNKLIYIADKEYYLSKKKAKK